MIPVGKNTGTGETEQTARREIIQSVLNWGHVITMSVLALAALANIGGFIAILAKPDIAEKITAYAREWQGFFVVGILGYDAKTTVENALKITQSVKNVKSGGTSGTTASNG